MTPRPTNEVSPWAEVSHWARALEELIEALLAIENSTVRRALTHSTIHGLELVRDKLVERENDAGKPDMVRDPQTTDGQLTVDEWLAIRREAGSRIDPETAEVTWNYARTLDPYGVYPDLPPECQQVGREYFARSPTVTFGSALTTYLMKPVRHFGKCISQFWHFPQVSRTSNYDRGKGFKHCSRRQRRDRFGRVPPSGVGAVGKWPADVTAESLAAAGHLSTAVVTMVLLGSNHNHRFDLASLLHFEFAIARRRLRAIARQPHRELAVFADACRPPRWCRHAAA